MKNDNKIRDVRILAAQSLLSPEAMAEAYPATEKAAETVLKGRQEVQRILRREDDRFLVVVGPCSIHEPQSAFEYAKRLAELRAKYADRMCIVMRVYFEKPRTTVGWRGLIVDPGLDGTSDIGRGLKLAREVLVGVNELGVPTGSEMLDPIVPQFTADLVSWASIGARTTESQTHREMASGLSMSVGFKNATDGDVQIAVNAIVSSRQAHSFIGITRDGKACIMRTLGNPDSHLILRGGKHGTNYDRESVTHAISLLKKAGIRPSIIVDCSHGNSQKMPENQIGVLLETIRLRNDADNPLLPLCGCMIESYLETGSQPITADPSDLKYGLSITDPCLGWEMTASALAEAYKLLGEKHHSPQVPATDGPCNIVAVPRRSDNVSAREAGASSGDKSGAQDKGSGTSK
jgi:3-deoxy-7-phosphoheptulonate synthase